MVEKLVVSTSSASSRHIEQADVSVTRPDIGESQFNLDCVADYGVGSSIQAKDEVTVYMENEFSSEFKQP